MGCIFFVIPSTSLFNSVAVVYEHRSRLERSLQKERSEHKKTKEGGFSISDRDQFF